MAQRWSGQPGRLEVWYATLTDPGTGVGLWLHHELVAPTTGPPRHQGWAVAFPPGEDPVVGRFREEPSRDGDSTSVFAAAGTTVRAGALEGKAGPLSWSLRYSDAAAPLHPFPRMAWERDLLPAAQAVAAPSARFTGVLAIRGRTLEIDEAPGAMSRIYGHGNAERWGWLHADLGAGDVIEVVAAVSRLSPLDRLPPLSFLQLRLDGRDWPRFPLVTAPLLRTDLRADGFSTKGRFGRRRLRAQVELPAGESVTLDYDDPEGPGPRCTNSERADLDLLLERRVRGGRWHVERHERLRAAAHAEVGTRP